MRRLLCLIVACSPAAPVPTVSVSIPIARATVTPPIAVATSCELLLAAQHEEIAKAIAASRKGDPDEWKELTDAEIYAQPLGIACHAFHGGIWAVAMVGSPTLYPRWKGISVDLGAVAYVGDKRMVGTDVYHAGYGADFTAVRSRLASDYDGDGIPELWMFSRTDGAEGGHSDKSGLYTAKTDVTAFGPTSTFADFGEPIDVDGDGILDLPTSAGIYLGTEVSCEGKSDEDAAEFVAHAKRDGTFSLEDDVAKAFVKKKWCPAPPGAVKTARDALCARLWKKPATKCVPWDCIAESQNKPQPPGADRTCRARIESATLPVPFTLP